MLSRDGAALLVNTVTSAPTPCDNGKNGFYMVGASLLPTLIRDLDSREEIIADDGAGANFTLSRTGLVTKWNAAHPDPLTTLTIAQEVSGYINLINPPLRAALHASVTEPDTGGVDNGRGNSVTVINSGALPVVITKLELFSTDIAAALANGDFSLADDRCSGRTLMPAETCQADVAQERAGADRQVRLAIDAEPASASTAVIIPGRSETVSVPASNAAATNSGGGGLFSLYLSAMAVLLAWVRRLLSPPWRRVHAGSETAR